jgi:hypothetical protein
MSRNLTPKTVYITVGNELAVPETPEAEQKTISHYDSWRTLMENWGWDFEIEPEDIGL